MSPEMRRWSYRVAVAVVLLLVAYGLIAAEHVELWMTLLTAVLAVPLVTADRHVPDAPDADGGKWRRGERVQ